MSSPDRPLTIEELEDRFAKLRASGAPNRTSEVEPLRWAYRQAACVLSRFEPSTLRPFGVNAPPGGALLHLVDDCETVATAQGETQWTLRQGIRRAAIARLSSRAELLRALETNPPSESDLLQRMISAWLNGTATPLETQELDELNCTLQVVHWFRPVLPELPDPGQVRRRLERLHFLAPFKYLVGRRFCGRTAELQKLRDYVGVVEVSAVQAVRQKVLESFGATSRQPLLIHGPGGMGKSTLLARFILEHADAPEFLPFAYLDFDDPMFSLEDPVTLVAEVVRQLHLHYPQEETLARLRRICEAAIGMRARHWRPFTRERSTAEELLGALDRLEGILGLRSNPGPPDDTHEIVPGWIDLTVVLGEALTLLFEATPHRVPRVLLVLDTFEEVQFRGVEQVITVSRLVEFLRESCPEMRVVICGRAPEEQLAAEPLALAELNAEAARELLRLGGVGDPAVATVLVEQLGGNPLTLKLAAEVALREGVGRDGIPELKTRRLFFFSAREAVIQGQLYRRILEHIHDPKVRKLAHPGLVLRRITPELIEQVLARPCALQLKGSEDAEALFQGLRREVSLVFVAADQSLHHRADVRQVMLEALKAEKPVQTREIHEAAVRFYERRRDVSSRAEEIYHRLALGEPSRQVEARWMKGVEPYLSNALEELPPSAKPFLAARLGLSLPDRMWQEARLADWELGVESRARALLDGGDAKTALRLMEEREERTPGSPLYALEANALAQLGKRKEALEVVEQALAVAPPMAGATSVPLLILRSELTAATGDTGLADESLRHAEQIARRIDRAEWLLQVLVARARLVAETPAQWRERAGALRVFLATAPAELLRQEVRLARIALGLVAGGEPELLTQGLRTVGFGRSRTALYGVRDVLDLLLRTGWPAALTAFESGEVEHFLIEVLRSPGCPPELGPWIQRVLVASDLPPEESLRRSANTRRSGYGPSGAPSWLHQAMGPLLERSQEPPFFLLTFNGLYPKSEALRTIMEMLDAPNTLDSQSLPLLFTCAELADMVGDTFLADARLRQAATIARRDDQMGPTLQALTRRAQLHAGTPEQWHERRNSLAEFLRQNSGQVVHQNPRLARLGIGLLGAAHPELLSWGLAEVGLGDNLHLLPPEAEDVVLFLQRTGWRSIRSAWFLPGKPERFLANVLHSPDCPLELPALLALLFLAQGSLELDTLPPSLPNP